MYRQFVVRQRVQLKRSIMGQCVGLMDCFGQSTYYSVCLFSSKFVAKIQTYKYIMFDNSHQQLLKHPFHHNSIVYYYNINWCPKSLNTITIKYLLFVVKIHNTCFRGKGKVLELLLKYNPLKSWVACILHTFVFWKILNLMYSIVMMNKISLKIKFYNRFRVVQRYQKT